MDIVTSRRANVSRYMILVLWMLNKVQAFSLESATTPESLLISEPDINPTAEPREKSYEWRHLMWTTWSEWSTCTSSVTDGFRVRNRVCPLGGDCTGDDVQLLKCNGQNSYKKAYKAHSSKYIEHCRRNNSLSCKLYLENPDLAYSIFRQNSCFFTANEDNVTSENTFGNLTDDVIDPPATENEDVMMSLSSKLMHKEKGNSQDDETKTEIAQQKVARDDDPSSNYNPYTLTVANALLEERKCRGKCDNTLAQASRLWALGSSEAQSMANTVDMLLTNRRLVDGVGKMFFEYNTCQSKCHSLQTTYSLLNAKSNPRTTSSSDVHKQDLKEFLKSLEKSSGIQKRDVSESSKSRIRAVQNEHARSKRVLPEVPSLCGGNTPMCPPEANNDKTPQGRLLARKKRQRPREYMSPCFFTESLVPNQEILKKIPERAELFFYESFEQRFTCRKCVGTLWKGNLYHPKETVLQWKNKQPAYCRQGFLKRHALFIVQTNKGRHRFRDGNRFSIESRTIEMESHCEIVILQ